MGTLKSVFKIPTLSVYNVANITLLDGSFGHCSSILLRGGWGEKHKIVQIAVFPITFVTDFLKNLQDLKCSILELLFYNQIERMHLRIASFLYKP